MSGTRITASAKLGVLVGEGGNLAPSFCKKEKSSYVRDTLTHPAKGLCPCAHPFVSNLARRGDSGAQKGVQLYAPTS